MKKIIKSFTFITLSLVIAIALSSCKGLLENGLDDITKDEVNNENNNSYIGGKTEQEAIKSVGDVNKIYEPIKTEGRFTNGQVLPNFAGPDKDALYEGKLIEYNSLNNDIKNYLKTVTTTGARHLEYKDFPCNASKQYVEFSTYTDVRNGNIIKYDLIFFDQSDNSSLNRKGGRVVFSPDLTMDIVKHKYIKDGTTCPPYKYEGKLIAF